MCPNQREIALQKGKVRCCIVPQEETYFQDVYNHTPDTSRSLPDNRAISGPQRNLFEMSRNNNSRTRQCDEFVM